MTKSVRHRHYITCQTCKQPMELYMATSEELEIVMTFECRHCQLTCEMIARTKPPNANPQAMH